MHSSKKGLRWFEDVFAYLLRALRAHRSSCSQFWEAGRWRIWPAVDCPDSTQRPSLHGVRRLDTDHTTCIAAKSDARREDCHLSIRRWNYQPCVLQQQADTSCTDQIYYATAVGWGIKRYRDPSVSLSVCLSHRAAAPGTRLPHAIWYAGCLQLSHVRTADPSVDGRRSAESRTAIGGGISSRRHRGDNLFYTLTRSL